MTVKGAVERVRDRDRVSNRMDAAYVYAQVLLTSLDYRIVKGDMPWSYLIERRLTLDVNGMSIPGEWYPVAFPMTLWGARRMARRFRRDDEQYQKPKPRQVVEYVD